MKDIMEIVKSLEEPSLLIKGVKKTSKRSISQQIFKYIRCQFIRKSAGKGVKAKIPRREIIRIGEQTIRAGQDF